MWCPPPRRRGRVVMMLRVMLGDPRRGLGKHLPVTVIMAETPHPFPLGTAAGLLKIGSRDVSARPCLTLKALSQRTPGGKMSRWEKGSSVRFTHWEDFSPLTVQTCLIPAGGWVGRCMFYIFI